MDPEIMPWSFPLLLAEARSGVTRHGTEHTGPPCRALVISDWHSLRSSANHLIFTPAQSRASYGIELEFRTEGLRLKLSTRRSADLFRTFRVQRVSNGNSRGHWHDTGRRLNGEESYFPVCSQRLIMTASMLDRVRRYQEELTAIRHDIHNHPELG